MTKVTILGSTGSIGESSLEVIRKSDGRFKVVGLSAYSNSAKLESQALEFSVQKTVLSSSPDGEEKLIALASDPESDIVVIAIVGFAALKPTLAALRAGKRVALANKEALVTCGELIKIETDRNKGQIIPVDSEHNSLYQALLGHKTSNVRKLWITGSGGPFRGKSKKELDTVDVKSALNHPKWKMGPKITIDSASLMNKGLEFIEAKWVFDLPSNQIDVLIHPQSIVHGIVEFIDGSMLAHMATPDMKAAISFALYYPDRQQDAVKTLDLAAVRTLEFEPVDYENFPCLELAKGALNRGGMAPTVLNAANEVAVEAFLKEKIRFTDIPELISKTLDAAPQQHIQWETVFEMDKWARQKAHEKIASL